MHYLFEGRCRPDLEALAGADDDHLVAQLSELTQDGRDQDAALAVELGRVGAGEELATQDAAVAMDRRRGRVEPGLGVEGAREWVAGAFEVVLEVARLRDERHRVLRVAEIVGVSAGEIVCQDIFNFVMDRTAAGGAIEGTFIPSGTVPQVVDAMRARGAALESAIFSRPPSR